MTVLQFDWIGFDKRRKFVAIVYYGATESKPFKLETIRTVILPPKGSFRPE